MGSSPPSAVARPSRPPGKQRPWYLIVALIGGWLLGAASLVDGCTTIGIYKDDRIDVAASVESVPEAERPAEQARIEHVLTVMDGAKNRLFPLAVAALILGGAMVATSARSMAGRGGARSALVQIASVQAVVAVAAYLLTPDVRTALLELNRARAPDYTTALRYAQPVLLSLRTLASALIVIALTRPRSRAFFETSDRTASGA